MGPAGHRHRATASSPTTWSRTPRRTWSGTCAGPSRRPTPSTSRPMRIARARPSPGTCSRCSSRRATCPVHRMVFHEITEPAIRDAFEHPARAQPSPGRRPGDPAPARPPLRLRRVRGRLEEGEPRPVRRPGPERRHPPGGRPRAGADGVRPRRVLGDRRHLRRPGGEATRSRRRSMPRWWRSTAPAWPPAATSPTTAPSPARTGSCSTRPAPASSSAELERGAVLGALGGVQALHPAALPAVHHLDAPAGRRPGPRRVGPAGDVDGPAALRGRLHHLHADRLDQPVGRRASAPPGPRPSASTASGPVPASPRALRQEGRQRPGGPRGHPPGGGRLPVARGRGPRGPAGRGPPLRDDLAAHHRQPDGRRGGRDRHRCGSGPPPASGRDTEFSPSGTVYTYRGWMLVEQTRGSKDEEERRLPALAVGDAVDARELEAEGHTTKAPARFTEATLVAKLEELGVGRPSTYASILDTDPEPGLRLEAGVGAGAELGGLRGHHHARAALRRARRLRLHPRPRAGPRLHRHRVGRDGPHARGLLLRPARRRRRPPRRAPGAGHRPAARRSTPPR